MTDELNINLAQWQIFIFCDYLIRFYNINTNICKLLSTTRNNSYIHCPWIWLWQQRGIVLDMYVYSWVGLCHMSVYMQYIHWSDIYVGVWLGDGSLGVSWKQITINVYNKISQHSKTHLDLIPFRHNKVYNSKSFFLLTIYKV